MIWDRVIPGRDAPEPRAGRRPLLRALLAIEATIGQPYQSLGMFPRGNDMGKWMPLEGELRQALRRAQDGRPG